MKETKTAHKKRPEITPPADFTHVTHIKPSDSVNDLVHALQTRVVPLDERGFTETVPLPRKATGGSYASGAYGGGTLGRGSLPRTGLNPTLFHASTSNLQQGTVSSAGYGTWNAGAKGKIKRGILANNDFLVPKSRAPDVPSPCPSSDGRYLEPAGGRHYRSVSASNDDVSLGRETRYVNIKPFGQPYQDPHLHYTHAENDGYLSPYSVLKPAPPPHRPASKVRASTVHVHEEIDVIFRPPREVAPPPPRDSRHETDANTHIAAPGHISIQLARPTDLFGPGLGLGLGGLGLGSVGIDDVVPLPCPGSLDSGVSEPPFPAPAPQPDQAHSTVISPEEVKEYLSKLRSYYSDLKDSNQLDSEGFIQRENLLKPAAEIILRDISEMETATRQKRPAPPPPVGDASSGASNHPDSITPTARPVPKPRTTKPPSASSSGAATPVGDAAGDLTTPTPPPPPAPEVSLEDRFNALPEAAVQLHPVAVSQPVEVQPSDDDDDDEITRL